MYKVVGFPKTRAFRVMWMLEELEQEYDIDPAAPRSDAAKVYNPSGKVPALVVDGETIIDSVAIVQFLADKHGAFTAQAGTLARGKQDSLTQFAVDDVEGALWFNAKNTFIWPEELRSETAREAAHADFNSAMKTLSVRLGDQPFVTGDTFTVPDLLLGHCAGWARDGAKWELPGGTVGAYFERVRDRPAFAKAMARRETFG